MDVVRRNNVVVSGRADGQPMVFAHGFGCDQAMWRFVAPEFEDDFRVVVFDHVGAGGSDLGAYDVERYSSLAGYATDVNESCRALDLRDVVLVGHSAGSIVAAELAAAEGGKSSDGVVHVEPAEERLERNVAIADVGEERTDAALGERDRDPNRARVDRVFH